MSSSSCPPPSPVENQHAPSRLPPEVLEDNINPNSTNTNANTSCPPPLTQQPTGQTPAGININPRARTPVTFGQQNARSYIHGGHRDGGHSGKRPWKTAHLTPSLLSSPSLGPTTGRAMQELTASTVHSSDWPHYSFAGVRQQTAELATIALAHGTPPGPWAADLARPHPNTRGVPFLSPRPALAADARDLADTLPSQFSAASLSSPLSSHGKPTSGSSHLSLLFGRDSGSAASPLDGPQPGVRAADGPAVPNERDPLLPRHRPDHPPSHLPRPAVPDDDRGHDLEAQGCWQKLPTTPSISSTAGTTTAASAIGRGAIGRALAWPKHGHTSALKQFSARDVWRSAVVRPLGFLPAVCLGLLLNVLDGLSYG